MHVEALGRDAGWVVDPIVRDGRALGALVLGYRGRRWADPVQRDAVGAFAARSSRPSSAPRSSRASADSATTPRRRGPGWSRCTASARPPWPACSSTSCCRGSWPRSARPSTPTWPPSCLTIASAAGSSSARRRAWSDTADEPVEVGYGSALAALLEGAGSHHPREQRRRRRAGLARAARARAHPHGGAADGGRRARRRHPGRQPRVRVHARGAACCWAWPPTASRWPSATPASTSGSATWPSRCSATCCPRAAVGGRRRPRGALRAGPRAAQRRSAATGTTRCRCATGAWPSSSATSPGRASRRAAIMGTAAQRPARLPDRGSRHRGRARAPRRPHAAHPARPDGDRRDRRLRPGHRPPGLLARRPPTAAVGGGRRGAAAAGGGPHGAARRPARHRPDRGGDRYPGALHARAVYRRPRRAAHAAHRRDPRAAARDARARDLMGGAHVRAAAGRRPSATTAPKTTSRCSRCDTARRCVCACSSPRTGRSSRRPAASCAAAGCRRRAWTSARATTCCWPPARRAPTPSSTPTTAARGRSSSSPGSTATAIDLVVTDHGRWREPRPSTRGRGMGIMRRLVDEVDVESGEDGTRVHLRRRVAPV